MIPSQIRRNNWQPTHKPQVNNLQTKLTAEFQSQQWQIYTVSGPTGQYKSVGHFAYLRVYGAGHEVPAYTVWHSLIYLFEVSCIFT